MAIKQTELQNALKSTGMPVTYGFFTSSVSPPFIVIQAAYNSDLTADNQNYVGVDNYQVELYTKNKDPVAEKKVQDLFKSLKLPYSKIETYIESEGLRQIIYEIQLIGG